MAPSLNAKFIRSHFVSPAPQNGPNGGMGWIMRLIYEFWGFCVNGDNSLSTPGGFSTSHSTGSHLSMPSGFASGSTVLLASGTGGETVAGMPYFAVTASSPFSASYVGKWLTMWKSGSMSTDDSVYRIRSWQNSSSISLDVMEGGTPVGSSGSVPQLTTRGDINWRVVDYYAASGLPYVSGNYMVVEFPNAADVNPGQRRSQAKIAAYADGAQQYVALRIQLSPSGSWDGTHFISESYAEITPELLTGHGSSWVSPNWWHGAQSGRTGYVTVIGGTGFVLCQAGGDFMNGGGSVDGSCFQIEIPQRLYPQALDPNPICAMNFGSIEAYVIGNVGYGYAHRFFPSPYDAVLRRWPIMVRSHTGSGFSDPEVWEDFSVGGAHTERYSLYYDARNRKHLMNDGVLCMATVSGQASAAGQFCLSRARVRTMRFVPASTPRLARFGDGSDRWIHVGGGVLWPWDHAIVSARPLFEGFS